MTMFNGTDKRQETELTKVTQQSSCCKEVLN